MQIQCNFGLPQAPPSFTTPKSIRRSEVATHRKQERNLSKQNKTKPNQKENWTETLTKTSSSTRPNPSHSSAIKHENQSIHHMMPRNQRRRQNARIHLITPLSTPRMKATERGEIRKRRGRGEGGKPHSSTSPSSHCKQTILSLKLEDSYLGHWNPNWHCGSHCRSPWEEKRARNQSTTQCANLVSYRLSQVSPADKKETRRRATKEKWRGHPSHEGLERHLVVGSEGVDGHDGLSTWLRLEDHKTGPRSRSRPYRILYHVFVCLWWTVSSTELLLGCGLLIILIL